MQLTTTYPVYQFEKRGDFEIDRYSTYFYILPNTNKVIIVESLSEVPDNNEIEYISIGMSWSKLQKNGCVGFHQHRIRNNYHALAIAVLRWAIENGLGDTISVVYRGVRDDFPDSQHLVIFGSPDLEVAKFYGDTIKKYRNIKGIKYIAACSPSVVTWDYDQIDEEVIFFPDQNGL